MNLDPYGNYDLFQDLAEVPLEVVIELGAVELKNRVY